MRVVAALAGLIAVLLALPDSVSAQTFRGTAQGSIGFGGATLIAGDQILVGRPGTLIGFPMPASHAGRGARLPPRRRSLGRGGDDGAEGRHPG